MIKNVHRVVIDFDGTHHVDPFPVSTIELKVAEFIEIQQLISVFKSEHNKPLNSYYELH